MPQHHQGGDPWTVRLESAPGEYPYRLRADGAWADDPGAARRVGNPFGTENGVLVIR